MTFRYRYVDYVSDMNTPPISLYSFPVLRKTPHGAWIDVWGKEKFVLDGEGRRFAHETLAQAWSSLKIRKERQIRHANAALAWADATLDAMSKFSSPPQKEELSASGPDSPFTFF